MSNPAMQWYRLIESRLRMQRNGPLPPNYIYGIRDQRSLQRRRKTDRLKLSRDNSYARTSLRFCLERTTVSK